MGSNNIAFLLAHQTGAISQLSVLNALLGAMRAIKATGASNRRWAPTASPAKRARSTGRR
jgi:hypothetical protein